MNQRYERLEKRDGRGMHDGVHEGSSCMNRVNSPPFHHDRRTKKGERVVGG